jgi:hypothetical protein
MQSKHIILELIRQDMRYNQFIGLLNNIGIEIYDFQLELMEIVAQLIDLEEDEITDDWMDLYVN